MTRTKKRGTLIKAATGIQGFDGITGGGLPRERTTLLMGAPGSGKTVFALQTLVAGLRRDEPGIWVTFQESPRQIVENAEAFGWDLAKLERDKLVILDARIRPHTFKTIELYLTGMLAGTRVVAHEMGARQIVFDSIDVLFSLLGNPLAERHEIFRLRDWLLESSLLALVTIQIEEEAHLVSQRHGFMQSMADCVIKLNHHPSGPSAGRSLRVLKYRGSGFAENESPLVIGPAGMEISSGARMAAAGSAPHSKSQPRLQDEISRIREDFQARLESLNRQLEIKQAEIDFLSQPGKAREGGVGRGGTLGVGSGVPNARKKTATVKKALLPASESVRARGRSGR